MVIGGDSAGVAGWSITTRADEKVFHTGDFLMGFCGSFRMGQLLRYSLKIGNIDHKDPDRWMATTFVDTVRQCLKDSGYATIDNNAETGGKFLVGLAGRLYAIESDYQVGRSLNGYLAIGCGDDIALGSLHTTSQYDIAPKDRARMALEAAAHLSGGVCAPFVIKNQPA